MGSERSLRVSEAIRDELSDVLRGGLKDPRIGFASIVRVEVSRDLSHARVLVSVYGDESAREACLAGLDSARGYLRSELAGRLRLRHVPELTFQLDRSIEHGVRINELLEQLDLVPGDDERKETTE